MRNRAIYTGIVIVVSLLAGLVFNVLYIKHVDRLNDERDIERSRQICELIVLLDDRNQSITPTSEIQRQFIDAMHRFRVSLGCPK